MDGFAKARKSNLLRHNNLRQIRTTMKPPENILKPGSGTEWTAEKLNLEKIKKIFRGA